MRVVFMGTPDFSVPTLECIIEAGHEVVGVVTQPDKAKGRGKKVVYTPVKEKALEHGLTVYQPRRAREPEFIEQMRALNPDVMVVVAFGQILPKELLDLKMRTSFIAESHQDKRGWRRKAGSFRFFRRRQKAPEPYMGWKRPFLIW